MVWCGVVCGLVWCGVWYGMVWYGMAWHGMVWCMVWYGIWYGIIWYDIVWYGIVFCGVVSFRMVSYDVICFTLSYILTLSRVVNENKTSSANIE